MFRAALAVALVLTPDAAVAGKSDCRWQPPAQYRGEAQAPYRVIRLSQPEVQEACAKGLTAAGFPVTRNYRGCALAPVTGELWRIYIVRGGYKCASEESILEHELGHVNGWPHDHPTHQEIRVHPANIGEVDKSPNERTVARKG